MTVLHPGCRYYRRDGTPYEDMLEWAEDFENTDRIVAYNRLWNGLQVSTVWLGLNHQFGDGPPLIFETMVFPNNWWTGHQQKRYSTESEAVTGHEQVVHQFSTWPLYMLWPACRYAWQRFWLWLG